MENEIVSGELSWQVKREHQGRSLRYQPQMGRRQLHVVLSMVASPAFTCIKMHRKGNIFSSLTVIRQRQSPLLSAEQSSGLPPEVWVSVLVETRWSVLSLPLRRESAAHQHPNLHPLSSSSSIVHFWFPWKSQVFSEHFEFFIHWEIWGHCFCT